MPDARLHPRWPTSTGPGLPRPTAVRGARIPFREIPRPGGGTRRLAELPDVDDRSYEIAVAQVLPAVERALGPEVFADRAMTRGVRIELGDWRLARRRLRRATDRFLRASPGGAVLVMDVRDCFASIDGVAVADGLRRVGSTPGDIERIVGQLSSFADRGVQGLPVGPAASTVLANAVLQRVDHAIRSAGLLHTRWVDDLTIFTPDAAAAARSRTTVRATLERLGLQANERKTRILSSGPEARRFLGGSPSAAGARRVP
jgi:hypothetical protein